MKSNKRQKKESGKTDFCEHCRRNTNTVDSCDIYQWFTEQKTHVRNFSKMKTKKEEFNEMNLDNLDEMSDEELQEAFAAGLIKPGLNIPCEEKQFKNNINAMNEKLKEFNLSLNWIERLDLISKPAPMPPEAHGEILKEDVSNIAKLKNRVQYGVKEMVMDDFKREMLFHRQAQSAVIEGIKRLKSLGIPTKRPDDYFAEMAKSDAHMHKVRQNLAARQAAALRAEKIGNLRRMKKLGKQTQVENKLKEESEKKKMLNEIKKFRKGIRKDLSFLDNNKNQKRNSSGKALKNRALRNEKFGFGGKKRGSKRNTKESAANVRSLTKAKKSGARNNKRLGKSRRIKKKSKK